MTSVKYETLENWRYGKATGYYDNPTDTIVVLKGSDMEDYTVLHEYVHVARRDKLTFKIASIVADNTLSLTLNGCILITGLIALVNPYPFMILGLMYLGLHGLHFREEYLADNIAKKQLEILNVRAKHETK